MLLLLPQAVKYLYYKQKNELLPSELVMDIIITGTGIHLTFVTLPLIAISVMSRHPPYLDPGHSDYIAGVLVTRCRWSQ